MKNNEMYIVDNIDSIKRLVEDKSQTMIDYINENRKSKFILYYKYLTHSDLPTFGKATKVNSLNKNLLYYLTEKEMESIQIRENKVFETAHQSNIGLPRKFWEDIGMNDPRDNVLVSDSNVKVLNNFIDIFLVNDSMSYFNEYYTKKVFKKLNKTILNDREWENIDVNLNKNDRFTEIRLTQAVHGIGISIDEEFRKLRHHIFKNDILMLIIEKTDFESNLFVLPYKNPSFFTIIEEKNKLWENYLTRENKRLESLIVQEEPIIEVYNRNQQDKWRNLLAEEMKNYTVNDNEVFCPFTFTSADFDSLGTLFRASHIKEFSVSNENEKYDINNGLLLVANADALFDKHLITVSDQKELVFSFLIEQDHKLKSQLLLSNRIFKEILNEKRMKYLEYHRSIFFEKENNRRREI